MVGDEADRHDQQVAHTDPSKLIHVVEDVGLQPGNVWWPAAALIDQCIPVTTGALRHQAASLTQLLFVGASFRHR